MRKIVTVLLSALALTGAGAVVAAPANAGPTPTIYASSSVSLYDPAYATVTTSATTVSLQVLYNGSWSTLSTKTKSSSYPTVSFDITRSTGTGQYYYRAKVKFADGTTAASASIGVYYNPVPTPELIAPSVVPYGNTRSVTVYTYATTVRLQYYDTFTSSWVTKETKTQSGISGTVMFDIAPSVGETILLSNGKLNKKYRAKAEFSAGQIKLSNTAIVCYDGKLIKC